MRAGRRRQFQPAAVDHQRNGIVAENARVCRVIHHNVLTGGWFCLQCRIVDVHGCKGAVRIAQLECAVPVDGDWCGPEHRARNRHHVSRIRDVERRAAGAERYSAIFTK